MTARCPTCGQTTGSLGDLTEAERGQLVKELADELPAGGDVMAEVKEQAMEVASIFRAFRTSSHKLEDGRPIHLVAADLLEAGARAHARYEYLRRLNPNQFIKLWYKNISGGGRFDDLVDDAIRSGHVAS